MSGRAKIDEFQILLALKESALTNRNIYTRNIVKLSNVIDELNVARIALQKSFQASLSLMPIEISSKVIAETSYVTKTAAKEASKDLLIAFNDSINAARDAKKAFDGVAEEVVQTFNKRYWVALAFGFIGMLLGMVVSANWILPNWTEIRAITAEKATLHQELESLKEAKATLETQGARMKPFPCLSKPTRLCVRIDEQQGILSLDKDAVSLDGKYVIPYGY